MPDPLSPSSPSHRLTVSPSHLIDRCLSLGFAAAGVCDASPTRWRAELVSWLSAGKHGSMAYLAEHLPARLDPGLILPRARSAIMVADVYALRGAVDPPAPARHGRIARYARGRDYHTVMKKRLHALCDALRAEHPCESFRAFVDTAPVAEREYAARAGLGWTGKHTLLISPPRPVSRGSWMLLGGILTTLELSPGESGAAGGEAAAGAAGGPAVAELPDHCGTCTRCIDACPTQAITPYSVDARRCVSYLTIERREAIPPELHAGLGDWVYGCDICQEVCPHNAPISQRKAGEGEKEPVLRPEYVPRFTSLDLHEVLSWRDEDRASILSGSAMKRATLAMLKRNALIVLANHALATGAPPELRVELEQRCRAILSNETEPPLLRKTAHQTLTRLGLTPDP